MAGVTGHALRWAVLCARLDPVEGHEQAGRRPVLVVSFEPFHNLDLLTVVPITAARSIPRLPGDIAIPAGEAGLSRPSVIICSQVRTISVLRASADGDVSSSNTRYLVSPTIRRQVRAALAHHLFLDVRAAVDGAEGTGRFIENV
jgi:mRNA interferase MazF